jgi:tetratricopeptide (TPR) repeat protein
LVREALLEDVSALRKARLHLRVADAIERGREAVSDDEAEVLAEHLWRAVAVGVGARAAVALERAAEVAMRRVAFATAEDLLQRAVELRRSTGTTLADQEAELLAIHRLLAVARARSYFAAAASPPLIERAKELAERTGRRDVLIDILWVEWSAATTASRLDEAEPLAMAFVEVCRASPNPDHHAFAEDLLAIQAWQAGRITESVERLERSAELRKPVAGVASFEFAGERQILGRLFMLLMGTLAGTITDAVPTLEALVDEQRDRFVITEVGGFASVAAEILGDWDGAERIGRRMRAIDCDGDFSFYTSMALMGLGVALARKGQLEEATRLFCDNRARYVGVGGGSGLACHDANWAIALAEAGCLDDAREAAQTARDTLDRLKERWNEPLVLLAEGVVAHAGGDVGEAEKRLAEAKAVAEDQGSFGIARRVTATAAALGVPLSL